MDNQHRKIKGYRELDQGEINAMNKTKELAQEVGEFVEKLAEDKGYNQRWVSIAKTDLQKGFMALTRSIAKPDFF